MAKNNISQYDATASNNTDVANIDIDEGMAPSNVNNAMRAIMAHLKDMDVGTSALTSPDFTAFKVGGTPITTTAAQLNFVTGVTSNIQTQLDSKGTIGNLADLGITASADDLNRTDVATVGLTEASKVVTADANGVVSFDNGTIEEVTSVTSSSNAATINLRDGNVFEHDLTENVTYTFSNPAASGRASCFVLKVIQDSTARTITWPASVDWDSSNAPILTSTNNGVDVFGFLTIDGGTTYYGFTLGQAMA